MRFRSKIYSILCVGLMLSLFGACKSNQATQETSDTDGGSQTANTSTMQTHYNGLKPVGTTGSLLKISRNGSVQMPIVIRDQPNPGDKAAAVILQTWLQEMVGSPFPIVSERQAPPSGFISVGLTKQAQQALPQRPNLGKEGYQIFSRNQQLYLLGGTTTGLVNAVFAFLEEDLGCRWYGPKTADHRIPKQKTLEVAVVHRHSSPAFSVREMNYYEVKHPTWVQANRTNTPRTVPRFAKNPWEVGRQYPRGWAAHTFFRLVPAQTYNKSHPEYFAERKGTRRTTKHGDGTQLCLTNQEVVRIATKTVQQTLDANPQATLISVSQNDGGGLFCTCKNCQRIHDKEGSHSGHIIQFVNQIADKIAISHPKVSLVTFAYKESAPPPKTIRPRKNVIVELATDVNWTYRYNSVVDNPEFVKYIKGWRALGTRLYIWDYPINLGHYLMPLPNIEPMAENLRFFQQQQVEGVMFQGAYQKDNDGAAQTLLRSWVWGKMMWNPQLDPKKLIEDFISGYYGNAAPYVQKYNDLLLSGYAAYQKSGQRLKGPFTALPNDLVQKGYPLIKQAQATKVSPAVKKRINYLEASLLYYRLEQGPQGSQDIQAYEQDLATFQRICVDNGIRRVREQMGEAGSIEPYIQSKKISVRSSLVKVPKGNIREEESSFLVSTVWPKEEQPVILEERRAENQYVIRHKASVKRWRLYFPIDLEKFEGNNKYRIKVSARADQKAFTPGQKGSQKEAFLVMIYDTEKQEKVLTKKFMVNELPKSGFKSFDVGAFNPGPNQRLIILTNAHPGVEFLYVDYVEFSPVP